MTSIFPVSASVGQEFSGYSFDGESWNLIGNEFNPTSFSSSPPLNPKAGDLWVDSDEDVDIIDDQNLVFQNDLNDYLSLSSASTTYLTQTSASTTYQTKVANIDDTEIGYLNNASANIQTQLNSKANLSGATFSGNIIAPEVRATTKLVAQTVGGDEGGEILLGKAATNTTLTGDGVTIDVWQNRLRIFEQGGDARGGYIDISKLDNGVATNLTPGLVQIIPTSLSVGSTGSATVSSNGAITVTNGQWIIANGVFTSAYQNYKIIANVSPGSNLDMYMRFCSGGTQNTSGNYFSNGIYMNYDSTSINPYALNSGTQTLVGVNLNTGGNSVVMDVTNPQVSGPSQIYSDSASNSGTFSQLTSLFNQSNQFDGFQLYFPSATIYGKIRIYGYNNGGA